MNWFIKLVSTEIFQSIISGVVLLLIGEYLKVFVLEPIKEFKGCIGKIDNKLKFYANRITNSGLPPDFVKEARDSLRNLSCDLESIYKQIPNLFIYIFRLPCKKQISDAATELIHLSNTAGEQGEEIKNGNIMEKIRNLLTIKKL